MACLVEHDFLLGEVCWPVIPRIYFHVSGPIHATKRGNCLVCPDSAIDANAKLSEASLFSRRFC
jgi:hypothetical protein